MYYRIRIMRPDGGWTISRPRYNRIKAQRLADAIRIMTGRAVHVDQSGPGWHTW